MKNILRALQSNIQLWICPAVYIWGLAFQANIAGEDDPFFHRVLDSSAVLLTMVFWASTVGSVVIFLTGLARASLATRISRFIGEAGILGSTVYYLHLMLSKGGFLPRPVVISLSGLFAFAALGVWVFFRRHGDKFTVSPTVPTLQHCFQFGAIPVILAAALIVGARISTRVSHIDPVAIKNVSANSPAHNSSKPNVILIVIDTLRAQSMSLYGYNRRTTPHIDEFARHSDVYLHGQSNATMTKIVMTTLLTGKHPFSHGRISPLNPPYQSRENLLSLLIGNSYTTAAVTSDWAASLYPLRFSEILSQPEISNFQLLSLHSFQSLGVRSTITGQRIYKDLAEIWGFFGIPKRLNLYGSADSTLQYALNLLKELNRPFFLYIHVFEPHAPNQPPPPFYGMYSTREQEELIRTTEITFYDYYPPEKQALVNAYKDKYGESIAFVDHELGNFLKKLDQSPWGEDTMVILTSDHGESLERGYLGHGEPLYESSTHIPLVIRWPHQKKGKRIKGLVQSIDIAPTILQAASIPVPASMDGSPLSPDGQVNNSDAVAINFRHPIRNKPTTVPTKLAIWWLPYKAIFDCETGGAELYDLNTDPAETTDLSSKRAAVLAELHGRLKKHLEKGAHKSPFSCADNFGF